MGYKTYGAFVVRQNTVYSTANSNLPIDSTGAINVFKVSLGVSQRVSVVDEKGNIVPAKDGTDTIKRSGVRGLKVKITTGNATVNDKIPNVTTTWEEFTEQDYAVADAFEYRFEQDGVIEYGRRT